MTRPLWFFSSRSIIIAPEREFLLKEKKREIPEFE